MHVQELFAGDSLSFLALGGAYPASEGWVLKYRLVPLTAGGAAIDITATAEGDDHRVALAAATTAAWAPDTYSWVRWVDKAGEVYTLEKGQLVVRADPRTLPAGYDSRSLAHKALDDAKAAYATFASSKGALRRYRIGQREMEFHTAAEILKQIAYWEAEVAREERAARLAKGLRPKNRIVTRFVRPS